MVYSIWDIGTLGAIIIVLLSDNMTRLYLYTYYNTYICLVFARHLVIYHFKP